MVLYKVLNMSIYNTKLEHFVQQFKLVV
jgi:hypothetical protein